MHELLQEVSTLLAKNRPVVFTDQGILFTRDVTFGCSGCCQNVLCSMELLCLKLPPAPSTTVLYSLARFFIMPRRSQEAYGNRVVIMPRAELPRHTVIVAVFSSVCLLQAFLVARRKLSAETSTTS